jgi:hypothetical protein
MCRLNRMTENWSLVPVTLFSMLSEKRASQNIIIETFSSSFPSCQKLEFNACVEILTLITHPITIQLVNIRSTTSGIMIVLGERMD